MSQIKIIDLFAGPGGLGEGFSNCRKDSPFEIAMSVECDPHAHKTLTLRAFYRRLNKTQRQDYYFYIQSTCEAEKKERFQMLRNKYKDLWEQASEETLGSPHALGNPKRWEKIRKGILLKEEDFDLTEQEQKIFGKIDEIKKSHDGPLMLIGGPPCQAYSRIGQSRNQGKKDYKSEHDERYYLYQEYINVLDAVSPDIFIMENVDNITSVKDTSGERMFPKIKSELRRNKKNFDRQYDIYSLVKPVSGVGEEGPFYSNDKDYIINACDFGIPQRRKRVILLGIKRKYGPLNDYMKPKKNCTTPSIRELIQYLPHVRSRLGTKMCPTTDTNETWQKHWISNLHSLAETLSDPDEIQSVTDLLKKRNLKTRRAHSTSDFFGADFMNKIEISYQKTLDEIEKLRDTVNVGDFPDSAGNDFFLPDKKELLGKVFQKKYPELYNWLSCKFGGITNHGTRAHMVSDLKRYLFCSIWAKAHKSEKSPSPKSRLFPSALAPDHKSWEKGQYADRFRAIEANQIPYTITSHLKKDGHAQIHYDPLQNRSLTAREAARVQTFPDDYYFEGPRGEQLHQIGNAVPSFLAKQIALHVIDIMRKKNII